MALWEDEKGEESDRSQQGDLFSQSCPGWLPVCRRSSPSSPPFNVSPTSSSLQSVMFLYSCDSKNNESALFPSAVKVTHCRGHRLSLYLLAAMRRCVTAGLKELINELTNQLEGWSVSGLQTPAEGHQFIPGQTGGGKVVRTILMSGSRLTIAYIWGGAKSGRVMWKPSWIIL